MSNSSNTRTLNQKDLINNILRGDSVSLSRAITLVESKKNSDRKLANNLLKECVSKNKKTSMRIGITGVPGVGKSTFIEALGTYLSKLKKKNSSFSCRPIKLNN